MRAGIAIIDKIRGTDILTKYDDLLVKGELNLLQGKSTSQRIADLLNNLKEHNAYYKPQLTKFTKAQIDNNPLEVLNSLPLMNKQLINDNYKKIYSPIKNRPTQMKKTGGSTGSPFYYYVDKEHLSWFWAYIYYYWNRFTGYVPGDPFITIAGNSLRTTNKRIAESIYHRLQHNYFITGDIIDKNIDINFAKTNKAILLYGYPSSILNMIKTKPELLKNVNHLKAIFTTSEQLTPQIRRSMQEAFNVPVYDMYGANDGGILTCECQEHNGYHINVHNCYVESFENEYGMTELLLTNLNSYGFPLVRYRVGDLGRISNEPCTCGLDTPKVIELKGRTRDLIKLPGGKSVHGSFFNNVFYRHPVIDGYKIVQQKDLSLTLYLHLREPLKFKEIAQSITDEIHLSIENLVIHTELMTEMNPTNEKFKLIESHAI